MTSLMRMAIRMRRCWIRWVVIDVSFAIGFTLVAGWMASERFWFLAFCNLALMLHAGSETVKDLRKVATCSEVLRMLVENEAKEGGASS